MFFRSLIGRPIGPGSSLVSNEELLELAVAAVANSPLIASCRRVSKLVETIELCLLQQEKLLLTSPGSVDKEAILRSVATVRALCRNIRNELGMPEGCTPGNAIDAAA